MTDFTRRFSVCAGLAVIAAISTFVLLMIAAGVISGLPRAAQGESVIAPWSVCILGSLTLSFSVPWLVSLPLIHHHRQRMYFLLCLVAAVLAWYFLFEFGDLLSKAYRRGL